VFAIAVVSAILLGKDTLRLRVIHLPVSVVVAGFFFFGFGRLVVFMVSSKDMLV
jgi:hypothetical protein